MISGIGNTNGQTHGLSYHPIYKAWQNMRQRCSNERRKGYEYWGGKGVRVCEEWESFENFVADMLPTWQKGLSLDRVNVNKGYSKENCRWATAKQQANNRGPRKRKDKNMDMKKKTVGTLIDELVAVREERRKLAEKDKELAKDVELLSEMILAEMDAQGAEKVSSKKATASISKVAVANVTDWEKFWSFIHKNKFNHLLQRRVSDPAYRELTELAQSDKKLAKQLADAGVETFIKTNLNLRAL